LFCREESSGARDSGLDWSRSALGQHVGLTPRTVRKLERGEAEPHRTTLRAIEAVWQAQGIEIEDWRMAASALSCARKSLIDRRLQRRGTRLK